MCGVVSMPHCGIRAVIPAPNQFKNLFSVTSTPPPPKPSGAGAPTRGASPGRATRSSAPSAATAPPPPRSGRVTRGATAGRGAPCPGVSRSISGEFFEFWTRNGQGNTL